MSKGVLIYTQRADLLLELRKQLGSEVDLIPCDDIAAIEGLTAGHSITGVLVDLSQFTLNGHSAGHFLAELDEATDRFPVYGLIDQSCPPRLRKLALKTIEQCLEAPLNYDRLRTLLIEQHDLEGDLEGFWSGMPHKELHGTTRSLVTFTPEMFEMMDEIRVAARHNVTMLLVGETGCGKTFLARLIHELSDRRDQRLCTVACGALPPDLIESELFGHAKGAFTGADREREGKFAAAGTGTLLLDEIDALTPEQQAKLLRVIETGEYEPVGSNETRRAEARLVVASNYNLEDLVKAGTFRTDLYYRLNILGFRLLSLRERPWDIEYLARKFALEHSRAHGITLRSIEPEFFEVLRRYPWPGNVREMENVIRRAVLYCQKGLLTLNDLPSSIRAAVAGPRMQLAPNMGGAHGNTGNGYTGIQPGAPVLHPSLAFKGHMLPTHSSPPGFLAHAFSDMPPQSYANSRNLSGYDMHRGEALHSQGAPAVAVDEHTLEARVDVMEQRIIEDCLRRNNHRRKETAAELGISRVTLYNKMKKFGML